MILRTRGNPLPVLAILSFSACSHPGPDLGPYGAVFGTVTFQGAPVAAGMITFNSPDSGQVATVDLGADGSYRMQLNGRDGLPVGKYLICVRPPLMTEDPDNPNRMHRNRLYDPLVSPDIPLPYRSEVTSDWKLVVAEGDNRLDLDMVPREDEP